MYFVKAHESKNEWWRYLITLIVVLLTQVIGSIPLLIMLALKQIGGNENVQQFRETLNFEAIGVNQNTGLILMLIPSVLSFFGLIYLMIYLHKKSLGEIASADGQIRWKRIVTGSMVWLGLLIIGELIAGLIHPGNYVFHFEILKFIPLFFIAIILIPFQAGFEELLFRSYLMAGSGLLFRYRIIALLITSVIFGMLHLYNPEVREYGLWSSMFYYIGFGLFAGLLVVMDNGIELAIGVHAINNIYGAVFVTYESSALQTPALWKMKTLDPLLMNTGFLLAAIIFLVFFARLYKWRNWNKMFRKVQFA